MQGRGINCRIGVVREGLTENKDLSKDLQEGGREPRSCHGGRLLQDKRRAKALKGP